MVTVWSLRIPNFDSRSLRHRFRGILSPRRCNGGIGWFEMVANLGVGRVCLKLAGKDRYGKGSASRQL